MFIIISIKATFLIHEDYIRSITSKDDVVVMPGKPRPPQPCAIIYGRRARYKGSKATFYINSEQLTRKVIDVSRRLSFALLKNSFYCDYSQVNLELLRQAGGDALKDKTLYWVPYQYKDAEVAKLRGYMKVEPICDVAVIGSSGHRQAIMADLRKRGMKVIHVQGFSWKRDARVPQAKILLNLHISPDAQVFEHIRCDRWIFAGMPVVSEECLHTNLLDVKPLVTFFPVSMLGDGLQGILDRWDDFHREWKEVHAKVIPEIRRVREDHLQILRDAYAEHEEK